MGVALLAALLAVSWPWTVEWVTALPRYLALELADDALLRTSAIVELVPGGAILRL